MPQGYVGEDIEEGGFLHILNGAQFLKFQHRGGYIGQVVVIRQGTEERKELQGEIAVGGNMMEII